MALSQNIRAFGWGDGLTLAGQDLRLATISALSSATRPVGGTAGALAVGSGVRDAGVNPLRVTVAGGLSVQIAAGLAVIQGSASANAGAYAVCSDSIVTLTCSTADPVNARIDLVCATVTDLGSSSSTAAVQIVTGTPAASPAVPATPSNSIALCQVTVAASATTLSSGNLADVRPYYAAAGGITPITNASMAPVAGPSSGYVHNIATGRLSRYNSATAQLVAPAVAPFATVASTPGTITGNTTSYAIASSVNVTVDGNTSVEITASFKDVPTGATSSGNACTISVLRGSTVVGSIVKTCFSTNPTLDGGSFTAFDPTPAAGTYTYSIAVANQGAGSFQINSGQVVVKAAAP